jgi:chemotaxis protein methyltransferase CheR
MRAVAEVSEDIETLEMDLILQSVHSLRGFDFSGYSRGSLRRRLRQRAADEGLRTLSGLLERVLHDGACMDRLIGDLSISVTSMFRNPAFYRALRQQVVPRLRTYPYIRVWVAGCATGEEAFSLAIVLAEEGLYERTRIYATDMNESALAKAEAGTLPIEKMRDYTEAYFEAGGTRAFVEYYVADRRAARLDPALLQNISFAQHNLATDGSFNEFNLILCRNVIIYFARPLQERVHELILGSLAPLGVLGLGERETVRLTPAEPHYVEMNRQAKLFRKIA